MSDERYPPSNDQTETDDPFGTIPPKVDAADHQDDSGAASQIIGPYKLLQQLGVGGMGAVWMAEQSHPVKRRVALKLIKPGYGSRETLSRFDGERQALALMNHPNIARILDAGTTESGQPWFVMELVTGTPLTTYCDTNRLSIDERLTLFSDVCAGVQHAHQKGIIHRDLKPGNIIVGMRDGQPVPKIIDFGLAKAMDHMNRLTDQSLFTGIGQVLGTLKYMSPEQAGLDSIDIDTRTDIYALGIILYELLTGSTPLDDSTMKQQAMLKVLEFIRDKEPIKPSSRLSSSSEEQRSSITNERRTDGVRLNRILAGDLDWIVMKALEKDRTRRYATASGFADDIRNYLDGEVVTARPPSASYRIKKFVRRNRAGVIAASLITLTLIGSIVATSLAMVRAQRAEMLAENRAVSESQSRQDAQDALNLAKVETAAKELALEDLQQALVEKDSALADERAISDFVKDDFLALTSIEGQTRFGVSSDFELSRNTTLRELLDRAAEKLGQRNDLNPATLAELNWMIGVNYRGLGEYPQAIKFLKRAHRLYIDLYGPDHLEALTAGNSLAVGYADAGQLDKALALHEQTLKLRIAKLGDDHPDTLGSMNNLAAGYQIAGQVDKALPLFEQTLERTKAKLGVDHYDTLMSMANLALVYHADGQLKKALLLNEQTLELRKAKLGDDHPDTLASMNNLAEGYRAVGNLDKALPLYEQTLDLMTAKLGGDHPDTLMSMNNLAEGYRAAGQLDKALPLYEQALELRKAKLGDDHPQTLASLGNLAIGYFSVGQLDKALPLLELTLTRVQAKLGDDHPDTLASMNNLARGYHAAGQLDKAIPLYEQTLKLMKVKLGDDHPGTLAGMSNLAEGYFAFGQLDKALPLYLRTLELLKAELGDDHPQTLTSMAGLARAYWKLNKLDQSIPIFEEVVRVSETLLGRNHPDTLHAVAFLGVNYRDAGRPAEAISLLAEAVRHIPRVPQLNWASRELRKTHLQLNRKDGFAGIVREELELARVQYPPGSTELSGILTEIGRDLNQIGDFEYAEQLLRESLAIREEKLSDDWRRFIAQSLLGEALLGRAKNAKKFDAKDAQANAADLLKEAQSMLEDGYAGLKQRADSIPETVRQQWLTEAVDRLIKVAERSGDDEMLKKWQAEKESMVQPVAPSDSQPDTSKNAKEPDADS